MCARVSVHLCAALLIWLPLEQQEMLCVIYGGAMCVCARVNVHLCAALLIWLLLEQQDRLCLLYMEGRVCVCVHCDAKLLI